LLPFLPAAPQILRLVAWTGQVKPLGHDLYVVGDAVNRRGRRMRPSDVHPRLNVGLLKAGTCIQRAKERAATTATTPALQARFFLFSFILGNPILGLFLETKFLSAWA
jgi:hypothetical protein